VAGHGDEGREGWGGADLEDCSQGVGVAELLEALVPLLQSQGFRG
jgi:hypothetical protein